MLFEPASEPDDPDSVSWVSMQSAGRSVFSCVYCDREFAEDDYAHAAAAMQARDQHQRDAHADFFSSGPPQPAARPYVPPAMNLHRLFGLSPLPPPAMPTRASDTYDCRMCGQRFVSSYYPSPEVARRARAQHETDAHGVLQPPPVPPPPPFSAEAGCDCRTCRRRFFTADYAHPDGAERARRQHEAAAHGGAADAPGTVQCRHCDRCFFPFEYAHPDGAGRALRQHEAAVHGGVEVEHGPLQCRHCGRSFCSSDYAHPDGARRALRQHEEAVHGGGAEEDGGALQCRHCDRCFLSLDYAHPDGAGQALRQHMAAAHGAAARGGGGRTHACRECARQFRERDYPRPEMARLACTQHERAAHRR
jgi:hypothetical protein